MVLIQVRTTMKPQTRRTTTPEEDAARKTWDKMSPVYFPKWAWEVACRKNPLKYTMKLPVYQNQKVVLT